MVVRTTTLRHGAPLSEHKRKHTSSHLPATSRESLLQPTWKHGHVRNIYAQWNVISPIYSSACEQGYNWHLVFSPIQRICHASLPSAFIKLFSPFIRHLKPALIPLKANTFWEKVPEGLRWGEVLVSMQLRRAFYSHTGGVSTTPEELNLAWSGRTFYQHVSGRAQTTPPHQKVTVVNFIWTEGETWECEVNTWLGLIKRVFWVPW